MIPGNVLFALAFAVSAGITCAEETTETFPPPPGRYVTSWVGNSFPGDGGPNGFGYWVQNGADEIEVTPDGTVLAGTDWDEAGRCAGLYKDSRVNRVLLRQESAKETAWGWNTGNRAVAVDGTNVFIANTGGRLLRFTWTPGDLDSAAFAEERTLPGVAVGLATRNGILALAYSNRLDLCEARSLESKTQQSIRNLRDVALAPDGTPWILAGDAIQRRDAQASGNDDTVSLCPEVVRPTALAFGHDGLLLVCDDGPDQQVKFYDITGARPRLVRTFGERGGLRHGTHGLSAPNKLYAPRGAGTDAAGNLYVALGFNGAPVGTLVLRSFAPDGTLRWEMANHAFVDTFGFDPESDGTVVYSRTAIFDLDLTPDPATGSPRSGRIWRQRATTIDSVAHPDDPRPGIAMTAYLRHPGGRRLLYTIGQYGGGFRLFSFPGPDQHLARPAGHITTDGETWAWHVAESGDIWHGDFRPDASKPSLIRRIPFNGWDEAGNPRFRADEPDTWPWPDDFQLVRRVIYDDVTDTLFLAGYLQEQSIDSWGVCGKTLRRYDHWSRGTRKERWTIPLPTNPEGEGPGKPLSPSSLAFAGDYVFVGMVKPEAGRQPVHILRQNDGLRVGTFVPGLEVGGHAGWEDMPYAVAAFQRRSGEYLVLVEEDWRGKNLLYRWTP